MKRIFIYSEDISEPFDEGIKKAAYQIMDALSQIANIFVVYKKGNIAKDSFVKLETNRLLVNLRLRKIITEFCPDIILYIPRWCGTFASFIRMRVLHSYRRRSKSIMIIFQPKKLNILHQRIISFLGPDIVYTPSPKVMELMTECKIKTVFLPLTIKQEKFKILDDIYKKKKLREKYGLPIDKYIILHVGHINSGRNLEALIPLQVENNQVLMVSSSSTSDVAFKDEFLKKSLREKGIVIIEDYLENIEEIYQLSDIYVFPVISESGCISIPISILEARACGLPVITTDFGGLRRIFGSDERGYIYSKPSNFLSKIRMMKSEPLTNFDNFDVRKLDAVFHRTIAEMAER